MSSTPSTRRSGRRPGAPDTREAILAAAREAFASTGYEAASLRGVARAAGVDPALVIHYFGSKQGLFVAAMELPVNPAVELARILGEGIDGAGERLVRFFTETWDADRRGNRLVALIRSAASDEAAARTLRGFVETEVFGPALRAQGIDDPRRPGLVASQLLGLAFARYVVGVESIARLTPAQLAAAVGPSVQRYMTGDLPEVDDETR